MSGLFADRNGHITLEIIDNEWFARADNWDVECVGQRITIRSGPGDIALILWSQPLRRVVIERLDMQYEGKFILGNERFIDFSTNGAGWARVNTMNISRHFFGISL